MTKTLIELKKMLDDHYRNEARIMNEIHESNLSTEENKELEEFDYDGYHRIAEPHVYGVLDGKHELLIYQIAGGSSSGGLPDWRRVKLKKVSNFKIREQYFKGKRDFPSRKHSSFDRRLAIVN